MVVSFFAITMPKSSASADGVARVFTPPWNKKRLPPNSPHGTRHAAAMNAAAAAFAAPITAVAVPPSPGRVAVSHRPTHGMHTTVARSPLSPQVVYTLCVVRVHVSVSVAVAVSAFWSACTCLIARDHAPRNCKQRVCCLSFCLSTLALSHYDLISRVRFQPRPLSSFSCCLPDPLSLPLSATPLIKGWRMPPKLPMPAGLHSRATLL